MFKIDQPSRHNINELLKMERILRNAYGFIDENTSTTPLVGEFSLEELDSTLNLLDTVASRLRYAAEDAEERLEKESPVIVQPNAKA